MTGPRLLFVFNDAGFFLSHRLPVARAARQAGFDVHVATPPSAAAERIAANGFGWHAIPLSRRSTRPLRELGTIRALMALYRQLAPDLIEHATIKPVLYGGLAARLTRRPAVVTWMTGLGYAFITSGRAASLGRRLLGRWYRWVLRRPGVRVIFENPDDRQIFLERGWVEPSGAHLIKGAGVDPAQFTPAPEPGGVPVVALPCRMLRDKGVGEFVAAARAVAEGGRAVRFALIGALDPGNPAAVSESVLRNWVDAGAVEWWGPRDDMPAVLRGATLVCLPSYREGLPKVLVEAAACGRAIVTTDVPGCREVVRDGVNGLLVPVRDAAALAKAIGELLDDPARRHAMGAAGRVLMEREFSEEQVVSATLEIYREVLGPCASS